MIHRGHGPLLTENDGELGTVPIFPYFLHISRKNIGLLVSAYALLPKEVRSHVR